MYAESGKWRSGLYCSLCSFFPMKLWLSETMKIVEESLFLSMKAITMSVCIHTFKKRKETLSQLFKALKSWDRGFMDRETIIHKNNKVMDIDKGFWWV